MFPHGLRVLVVLPMYGGSLPIGHYCASALKTLGQNVRVFDSTVFYSTFSGLKNLDLSPQSRQYLEQSLLRTISQAIWLMTEAQKTQLVLALAQAPLDKMLLQKLRQANIRTVMWFVEDFQRFLYWRTFAPLYDAFAVIQKEPFISELAKIGQNHAFYLPLAALPAFHRHLDLTEEEKRNYGAAIGFMGAGYPNRRKAFRALAGRDFKIWGSDWDGEEILKDHIQKNGARIDAEESVKIYNASAINLNLHSDMDENGHPGQGDFVNPRTFELAAMGAFQLTDRRRLLGELFADNELAIFDSLAEMNQKIDYFMKNPQERKKIAEAGQKRVLKDHTYEKRMSTLLEYMVDNFGPFSPSREFMEELNKLPPDLREKIEELLKRLNIPLDAPFKEVIASIRGQSGALTDLETLLLFMDEWQKEYSAR